MNLKFFFWNRFYDLCYVEKWLKVYLFKSKEKIVSDYYKNYSEVKDVVILCYNDFFIVVKFVFFGKNFLIMIWYDGCVLFLSYGGFFSFLILVSI